METCCNIRVLSKQHIVALKSLTILNMLPLLFICYDQSTNLMLSLQNITKAYKYITARQECWSHSRQMDTWTYVYMCMIVPELLLVLGTDELAPLVGDVGMDDELLPLLDCSPARAANRPVVYDTNIYRHTNK